MAAQAPASSPRPDGPRHVARLAGTQASSPTGKAGCKMLDNGIQDKDIRREAYSTLLVGPDGKTSLFARH